jgi:hypothetical protein
LVLFLRIKLVNSFQIILMMSNLKSKVAVLPTGILRLCGTNE